MSLDTIIILVLVVGAVVALVAVNMNSRRKENAEKSQAADEK